MEIEIGDFVEIITGENVGFVGILDNIFNRDGVETFCVVAENDNEEFFYATEIKGYKAAR